MSNRGFTKRVRQQQQNHVGIQGQTLKWSEQAGLDWKVRNQALSSELSTGPHCYSCLSCFRCCSSVYTCLPTGIITSYCIWCWFSIFLKDALMPWLVWIECQPANQGSLVWFPVRARVWVVGQVDSWGHARGKGSMCLSHIDVSLPSPISENK